MQDITLIIFNLVPVDIYYSIILLVTQYCISCKYYYTVDSDFMQDIKNNTVQYRYYICLKYF